MDVHPTGRRRRSRGSKSKFANRETVKTANLAAFKAGYNFGETAELFDHPYEVAPAPACRPAGTATSPGTSRSSYGLVAASQQSKLPLLYASYPITPASDILHELSKHKNFGVRTLQAEDEIAAVSVAIGGAFTGHLGVTATSGPGVDLKSEGIGLAISLELPLVIVDVQRGGPSTGLPTKTEQADLLLAMYGRHGEAPLPIVAARSPSHCFDAAIEAVRLAVKYRTPVILLSDGYLANGAEPWLLPDVDSLPDISVPFATEPNHTKDDGTSEFWPYLRDPETLARPWAIPGTPGLMHRIGGIEKQDGTGNVNYDPENHELHGSHPRGEGGAASPATSPTWTSTIPTATPLLVLGWGSTWGVAQQAVRQARVGGVNVAHAHLVHLNPFPAQPRRGAVALRAGAGPRDEPRPALAARSAPSTSSTRERSARCRGCRSGRRRSRPAIREHERHDRPAPRSHSARRTSSRTRRSAGAPGAATTRSSRGCSCSCPSSGCSPRTSCSCPASAARRASPIT